MNKSINLASPSDYLSTLPYSAIDYLASIRGFEVDKAKRIEITRLCRDCDYIPKVKDAGELRKVGRQNVQIMHNGLLVSADGYYGSWVTDLIKSLGGHHEPQEEKVFYELSKSFDDDAYMIELGSYWAYYSLWFRKSTKNGKNICCEPDPNNIKIGEINFKLNNFEDDVVFINSAAGKDDKKIITFETEIGNENINIPIRTVDSIVKEQKIDRLEVLHMDVQGFEHDALEGAINTIKAGKLRYLFISTHHYLISRDPNIHQKCIDTVLKLGGHIICEHDIHESYSGDGLIVASFFKSDQDKSIKVSRNRMSKGQFRSYTKDLELTFKAYDIQLNRLVDSNRKQKILNEDLLAQGEEIKVLSDQIISLNQHLEYLNNLNVKGSIKKLIKAIYRSFRFRLLKIIWGKSNSYNNTDDLIQYINIDINSQKTAKEALLVINNADIENIHLVQSKSKFRVLLFELFRKAIIYLRRIYNKARS